MFSRVSRVSLSHDPPRPSENKLTPPDRRNRDGGKEVAGQYVPEC